MAPSDSDLSSLSSAPPTDDEAMALDEPEPVGIAKYFKKESETPPPKREPSPPHEYVLADNPNIAFIVMFRARFAESFPRSVPHLGPQDVEIGVQESPPGEYVERLLCALLGLVLNRKKEVEPLEEAISTHQTQWPKAWEGKNPLHGGRTFATMSPEERAKIKESYKQSRHDDDLNQPLSVQPWGRDSLKRRYWLIEGQDDTHFRLYRESNPALKNVTWRSVAGSIPEMQNIADKLQEEKGTNSKKLCERIRHAIPRFEASEEKRKRRDYRLARKAAFARPEPGFSMYEGRTRGKKLKYTYSDDEDIFSDRDDQPSRRSTRNAGNAPAEAPRTQFTASGRQVRSRAGGLYGEALLSGQREDSEEAYGDDERPQRARTSVNANGYSGYGDDDLEDESEARSSGNDSGNDWNSGDEEDNDFEGDDEGDNASGDESIIHGEPQSLVIQLRYGKGNESNAPKPPSDEPPPAQDAPMKEVSQTEVPTNTSAPTLPIPSQSASASLPAGNLTQLNRPDSNTTSSHFSSAPVSQLLSQQDAVPRTTAAYPTPSAPLTAFPTASEDPKPDQPANGWTGHATDVGNGSSVELPQSQPPPSHG
ncbi:hypothetical protein N7468_008149 [Penicillium chermesinum]|uniref:WHIM1 domain-containing protein n=1 Tax=Penicillium chermesinum TaxID=63820 RepID=A0A9W9TI08_9EURO|nr:uncharacterized protein N7468_008149 [Penicillium chermesinum]KAJ5223607.1 hypothetical protein N7468_008149 [Penicillium chermesinum]